MFSWHVFIDQIKVLILSLAAMLCSDLCFGVQYVQELVAFFTFFVSLRHPGMILAGFKIEDLEIFVAFSMLQGKEIMKNATCSEDSELSKHQNVKIVLSLLCSFPSIYLHPIKHLFNWH